MLDAAEEAIGYIRGKQRSELDGNRPLQHSLVRCVEIIGEAASRVSQQFQLAHPEIPWRLAIAMRNRLIHAYFDIELDTLWRTVEEELPLLVRQLQPLLKQDGEAGSHSQEVTASRVPPNTPDPCG